VCRDMALEAGMGAGEASVGDCWCCYSQAPLLVLPRPGALLDLLSPSPRPPPSPAPAHLLHLPARLLCKP